MTAAKEVSRKEEVIRFNIEIVRLRDNKIVQLNKEHAIAIRTLRDQLAAKEAEIKLAKQTIVSHMEENRRLTEYGRKDYADLRRVRKERDNLADKMKSAAPSLPELETNVDVQRQVIKTLELENDLTTARYGELETLRRATAEGAGWSEVELERMKQVTRMMPIQKPAQVLIVPSTGGNYIYPAVASRDRGADESIVLINHRFPNNLLENQT